MYEIEVSGRNLSIESGRWARQAGGAAVVRYGESVVLVTACLSENPRPGIDFLPLVVDYVEKTSAVGKIPGGFFKREGRLSEFEVLTSRMIDRPIRPLFPKGFYNEIQIVATVLSADKENDTGILAMIGASAALSISEIPFTGPIAGARVGRIDGKLVVNPVLPDFERSDLNIFVAGSRDAILMVEGESNEVSEEEVLDAILFAHRSLVPILDLQDRMAREIGKEKRVFEKKALPEEDLRKIASIAEAPFAEAYAIREKQDRRKRIDAVGEAVRAAFTDEERAEKGALISDALKSLEKKYVRGTILREKKRIDGRGLTDVRAISCEVGVLPRTHGSAVFTRGETQALVMATLGTSQDEQRIDSIMGDTTKAFMLHYNFPPFSVGEVKMLRGPGRREVGHGALAERAVSKVLPKNADFPYTVRVVSEVLESNGSSSMATVCGASMALMDAGVPIKSAVAGVAMGLIKEDDRVGVLSDILGDEDQLGDMDFKVAGTEQGITALQMDIKMTGLTREIMGQALTQAREARLHILGEMNKVISEPSPELKEHAPKIIVLTINPDKIREVIGPGGKMVKSIVAATGIKIDIEDDGKIHISSSDQKAAAEAIRMINEITEEAEIGKVYHGIVKKIMDFGAFVEIIPGTDGLVHISELAHERVQTVTDVLKEGDEVDVKVLDVDRQGKIRLSRRALLPVPEGMTPREPDSRPSRSDRDRRPGRGSKNRS